MPSSPSLCSLHWNVLILTKYTRIQCIHQQTIVSIGFNSLAVFPTAALLTTVPGTRSNSVKHAHFSTQPSASRAPQSSQKAQQNPVALDGVRVDPEFSVERPIRQGYTGCRKLLLRGRWREQVPSQAAEKLDVKHGTCSL